MEKGSAVPVDGADPVAVEGNDGWSWGILRVDLDEAAPAAPDSPDLMAIVHRAQGEGADRRVQSGHISAAGQDPNPGTRLHSIVPFLVEAILQYDGG
jgi:hypothetical protein